MKKFDVEITETLQRTVSVEAASQEEAERMVTEAWNNDDYVLDHIDYAVQKDLSCTPPRYMIYFKAQDTDALSAAFKEYSAAVLDKSKRPSVLAKLHDLVANLPDKVRHKQEERGL